MSWLDRSLGDALKSLQKMNAGTQSIILSSEDDTPTGALILSQGDPETSEVLNAVEIVEEAWYDDRRSPSEVMKDLVQRAYGPEKGCPPDLAREAFEILGEHRVLVDTRHGPVWLPPSDAETYRNAEQQSQIVDEINGNSFSDLVG